MQEEYNVDRCGMPPKKPEEILFMRAVQVTENAVSIWFSQEDIPSRGQMLTLVRRALEQEGYIPWPETEAECFSSGNDALVISRPGRSHRRGFVFHDLEELLGGALACPDGDSALYADGRRYVLSVAPELVRGGLYEFGTERALPPDWEIYMREKGACLMPDRAIERLRRIFS